MSEKKTWIVPVEWAMCGVVEVEANTAEEACQKLHEDNDDIAIPSSDYAEYIDGSFIVPEFKTDAVERCKYYTELRDKKNHRFHLLNDL